MKRVLNALFFTTLLAGVAGFGIYAGYNAISVNESKANKAPTQSRGITGNNGLAEPEEGEATTKNDSGQLATKEEQGPLLNTDALLTFEYTSGQGGTSITKEQKIPYFLAGKNKGELSEVFPDWVIKSYSSRGAVLTKELEDGARQNYIVSVSEGFIAVYYDEGIDGSKLKEMTDTPVSALPPDEAERIKAGIMIQGEDSLMRLLEDLSS